jgi:hypothetical protein
MKTNRHTKLIHEGDYLVEVEIERLPSVEGWSPYLSVEDTNKLDDARDSVRQGNITAASKLANVYMLTPVTDRFAIR